MIGNHDRKQFTIANPANFISVLKALTSKISFQDRLSSAGGVGGNVERNGEAVEDRGKQNSSEVVPHGHSQRTSPAKKKLKLCIKQPPPAPSVVKKEPRPKPIKTKKNDASSDVSSPWI